MITDTTKWIKVFQTHIDSLLHGIESGRYFLTIALCEGLHCTECPFYDYIKGCRLMDTEGDLYNMGRVLLQAVAEQDALKATAYFEILKDIVAKEGQEDSIVKSLSK